MLAIALIAIACDSPTRTTSRQIGRNGPLLFGSDSAGMYRLYVVNADGSHLAEIPAAPIGGSDYGVWSPDGAWIAMNQPGAAGYGIDVVDRTGANRHTVAGGDAHGPAWSPDGSLIAFMIDQTVNGASTTEIGVVSADGGTVSILTHDGAHNYYPTWSPDGGQLAYMSD